MTLAWKAHFRVGSNFVRWLPAPLCLFLVACLSHPEDLPTAVINPPDPSNVTAVLTSLSAQAKLEWPLEGSAPLPPTSSSPTPFIIYTPSAPTDNSTHTT